MKKLKKSLITIFHGLKGSAIFFMLSIMFFAILKLGYMLTQKDLLLSKYTIVATIAGFVLIGFFYGIRAYKYKNHHYKLYSMTKKNFILNFILTIIFTWYFWYVLKNKVMPSSTVYLFFIITFVLFYAFSALVSNIHHHISTKKGRHLKKSTVFFAVIFNPIFVLIYFWLFSVVVYNSTYIPCGLSVIGVDKNIYTGNTRNLGITPDERIISVDGIPMISLQDVRTYMNSLDVTKEVVIETTKQKYLVKTYQIEGRRFMGLLLKEEVCERKY